MIFWVTVALAAPPEGDLQARARRWLGDYAVPADPKTDGTSDGEFRRAPVPHWAVRLPGPPLNSASHTERARPVFAGDRILVGSAAGDALYALDRRDGGVIGSFPATASVESEPLVVDDRVYFSDTAGVTFCYDLGGELLWKHSSNAPILTRPTVAHGRVYLSNVDDLALALDAQSGRQVWRYKVKRDLTRLAELALYASPTPTALEDTVVFGFSTGEVIGLDAERGEVRWSLAVGEGRYPDVVAEVVATDEDLFASGYFRPLVAIDRATQSVRWRVDAGAAFPVLVDETTVYHPGTDGRLRAYSRLTGAERWTWESGRSGALTEPVPTPAGLFVGSSSGRLYLVDPQTGRELWAWREPHLLEGLTTTPSIDGRQLVFVTNAGFIRSMVVPRAVEDRLTHRWFRRRE